MANNRTTADRSATRIIHTPAGMHVPSGHGEAADGADLADTDMTVEPGGNPADPSPAITRPPEEEHFAAGIPTDVAGRLLDVLDQLDRLVASDPDTPLQTLREGLAAADRKLREQLAAAGVGRASS